MVSNETLAGVKMAYHNHLVLCNIKGIRMQGRSTAAQQHALCQSESQIVVPI